MRPTTLICRISLLGALLGAGCHGAAQFQPAPAGAPLEARLGLIRDTMRRAPLGPPWCMPDTSAEAASLLRRAQRVGTVAEQAAAGRGWLVQDERLCARASAALDSTVFVTPRREAVYLLRWPSGRQAAAPIGLRGGEFDVLVYLDAAFRPEVPVALW